MRKVRPGLDYTGAPGVWFGMAYVRIAYPRSRGRGDRDGWERGEAWDDLKLHQIPGAPITIDSEDVRVMNPWRKDHTAEEWAWVYVGPGILGGESALDEVWADRWERSVSHKSTWGP